MNDVTKKFVKIYCWVALVSLIVLYLIYGIKNTIEGNTFISNAKSLFEYAGYAITVSSIFMWIFNVWLWRWKPVNVIAGKIPVLTKCYKVTIKYIRDGKEETRDTTIHIDQTYLHVSVNLRTNESYSNSITATIKKIDNNYNLIYTYLNTPKATLRQNSEIHYGTAMLRIDNPEYLEGDYYTSRHTSGHMELYAIENTDM